MINYIISIFIYILLLIIGILFIKPKHNKYGSKISKSKFSKFIGMTFIGIFISLLIFNAGATLRDKKYINNYKNIYFFSFFIPDNYIQNIFANNVQLDTLTVQNNNVNTILPIKSNTYEIPCKFNNKEQLFYFNLNLADDYKVVVMFDTGCSYEICISMREFYTLVGKGVVKEEDLKPNGYAITASGDQYSVYKFTLPVIKINNMEFKNVQCSVSEDNDFILVGTSMFKNFNNISIDRKNEKIILSK